MHQLKRFERGDTIIEVMIAVAVLGLAFAVSYATANRALQTARNSQEHGAALQYLNSQLELARADERDSALYNTSQVLCMDSVPGDAQFGTPVAANNPTCSIGSIPYLVSYVYSKAPDANGVNQDIFTFTITWPGLGRLGTQKENMSYKIHQPSVGAGSDSIGPGGSISPGGSGSPGGGGPAPSPTPSPTIALTAVPTAFVFSPFGLDSSRLSWSTTNASSCTSGGGTWTGSQNTSGSWTTPRLSSSTTYTLSCSGSGGTKTQTVTVFVSCPLIYRSRGLCR